MPRTQYPTRPQRRSKRRTREQKFLEQVHLNAAGIDIGSGSHWVAVPTDRDEQPVREFRSFTHALIDLADWLTACDIDTVAMESTGVYWVNSTGRRNTSMMRGCDAETETETVRPGGSACDAFAWPAAGNGACGAATVLEGDRAGAVE